MATSMKRSNICRKNASAYQRAVRCNGGGNYAEGATVTIHAGAAPNGQKFKEWTTTSAGVTFADRTSATTTFKMPANAVAVTATFETVTGESELFAPDLKIYPNPFADVVRITGIGETGEKGETGKTGLRVINAAGSVVHTQIITSPDEIIHLGHLPAGVYFFTIENGKQSKTVKAVKSN